MVNRLAESQLSGNSLENSFGHNFVEQRREQLWGAALGRGFEEQLCTAALENFSFGEHLFERNFGGAAVGSNFGEQLSGVAVQNSFGNRFEA